MTAYPTLTQALAECFEAELNPIQTFGRLVGNFSNKLITSINIVKWLIQNRPDAFCRTIAIDSDEAVTFAHMKKAIRCVQSGEDCHSIYMKYVLPIITPPPSKWPTVKNGGYFGIDPNEII